MTNRDDNNDSSSDSSNASSERATPSSLGLNLDSDDDTSDDESNDSTSNDGGQPSSSESDDSDAQPGPALGGQASDASADDDPTRNISREEVRQTLMGMPAQGDDEDEPEDPGASDPDDGAFEDAESSQASSSGATSSDDSPSGDLPSSQSLLEDSDDWTGGADRQTDDTPSSESAERADDTSQTRQTESGAGLSVPDPSQTGPDHEPSPPDQTAEAGTARSDDTQETPTVDDTDDTQDVDVEEAKQATSPPEQPDRGAPATEQTDQQDDTEERKTHETMMGMGAAPDADPNRQAADDEAEPIEDGDVEAVEHVDDELDDDFGAEKTMVSSSPFGDVEDDGDDLPEPGASDELPGDDFGEADLGDDDDLEEYGDYEKTMVSDDVLEGPPSDAVEDDGLDVTSSPSSPATESANQQAQPSDPAASNTGQGSSQPTSDTTTSSGTADVSQQPAPEAREPAEPSESPPPEHQQSASADSSEQPEDGDFSSQKTEIFSSPFENDPVCPKLSVLEGPSSGQEYLLNETRNTIGRSTKNSVVVPDESMSRQHLEVVKRPDGSYRVQDLQSVNGTYLNGTAIEEADLFHGDRIQTGRTTLQFLIPGDSPTDDDRNRRVVQADAPAQAQPAGAPGRTRTGTLSDERGDQGSSTLKRTIIGASILCALLLGAIGYLRTVEPGPTKAQQQARNHFLTAIEAIQHTDWDKAKTHLSKARKLAPDLPGLSSQSQRLTTERDALEALNAARSAAEGGNFSTAIKQARSIPRNSIYFDEAQEILRRQQRARDIERLLDNGRKAFENDDAIEALSTVEQVLKIAPTHPEALRLRYAIKRGGTLSTGGADGDAETSEEDDERPRVADAQTRGSSSGDGGEGDRAPSTESSNTGASTSDDSGGSSGEGSDDLWLIEENSSGSSSGGAEQSAQSDSSGGSAGSMDRGFELYKNQKFSAAISHFESIADAGGGSADQASSVASAIGDVQSSFDSGTSAISSQDWSSAVSSLRAALRADKQVADAGHLSGVIRQKLARAVAGQGQADLNAGNYADAYNHYKNAKDYDASHRSVRNLRRALGDKASSLYIQAANSKKTNPTKSATLCRTITSMVPPSDESYKKAKSLLNNL